MKPHENITGASEQHKPQPDICVARQRLLQLFDHDTFMELDACVGQNGASGVITATGYIGEAPVYAFSQDITTDEGAVNKLNAKKISKLYDLATKTGCPVIALFDSKGAKVSEGNEMLDAYGEIVSKANRISGLVPQLAAVLGTCAGTSALMACSSDVLVMTKTAQLFLNPPFLTAKNDQQQQSATAEFVAQAGIAAIVEQDDSAAIERLRHLISMLPQNNLSPAPLLEGEENTDALSMLKRAGTDRAHLADIDGSAIVEALVDKGSAVFVHKEFGKGVVTALGRIAGATVGLIVNDEKNGVLNADACDKSTRLIRFCDAFHIPIVTLVNTEGFEWTSNPMLIRKSAALAHAYSEATSPKITVIIGQAIGAAYLSFAASANADITLAWSNAVVSAMGLAASAEFLSDDQPKDFGNDVEQFRQQQIAAYIEAVAGAPRLAEQGYIDGMIAAEDTRFSIMRAMDMLAGKRESTLPKKHSIMPI